MSAKTDTPIVPELNQLLADSYALLAQTHLAHWNVNGPDFFQLHAAFQAQYEELFAAIDEIAERIRALDALAIGGLKNLGERSAIQELPVVPTTARDFVSHLITGHELVARSAGALRDAAAEAGDAETEDLAIARVQIHQKTVWMLKSYLK
jgi:starvation-inducible DNA-binding protein